MGPFTGSPVTPLHRAELAARESRRQWDVDGDGFTHHSRPHASAPDAEETSPVLPWSPQEEGSGDGRTRRRSWSRHQRASQTSTNWLDEPSKLFTECMRGRSSDERQPTSFLAVGRDPSPERQVNNFFSAPSTSVDARVSAARLVYQADEMQAVTVSEIESPFATLVATRSHQHQHHRGGGGRPPPTTSAGPQRVGGVGDIVWAPGLQVVHIGSPRQLPKAGVEPWPSGATPGTASPRPSLQDVGTEAWSPPSNRRRRAHGSPVIVRPPKSAAAAADGGAVWRWRGACAQEFFSRTCRNVTCCLAIVIVVGAVLIGLLLPNGTTEERDMIDGVVGEAANAPPVWLYPNNPPGFSGFGGVRARPEAPPPPTSDAPEAPRPPLRVASRPPPAPYAPLPPLSPMASLAHLPEVHTEPACEPTYWGNYRPQPVGRNAVHRFMPTMGATGVDTLTGRWQLVTENVTARAAVVRAMRHAWEGYKQYAWGYDELKPVSRKGVDNFGGMGVTIIDSLSTLWLMEMYTEFEEARAWVAESLNFDKDEYVSVFETTIRMLGGLLSAYDMSGDDVFRERAVDLGRRLMRAFETKHRLPFHKINLRTGEGIFKRIHVGTTAAYVYAASLAEVGTLQLEFNALTRVSGDPSYARAAAKAFEALLAIQPPLEDSLIPVHFNPYDLVWSSDRIVSLGANGDSFYEYLLKVWIQQGKGEEYGVLKTLWGDTMDDMIRYLKQQSSPSRLKFIAQKFFTTITREMNHLACFAPGMLVLGHSLINSSAGYNYLENGQEVLETCFQMYNRSATGLAPESVFFPQAQTVPPGLDMEMSSAPNNFLRPETVESLFLAYRRTGDEKYRKQGWQIFEAFETYSKVSSGGYSGLVDVNMVPPTKDDVMQSFFLAETLKYLYLLYSSSNVLPLDVWVFNTEAHPLQIHCNQTARL